MMGLFKILLIFVFFLLVNPVIFSTDVFSDRQTIELCPRETDVFVDRVRNDEDVARNYNIILGGSASSWAVVAPAGFILVPGEEKIVYVYTTAPRDTRAGNYNLQVNVDSGASRRTINHVVKIKECYGFSLSAASTSGEVCPSASTSFRAVLTNSGEFAQNFNLNLDGSLSSSSVLSENAFILQAGESKNIVVNTNAPSESGSYNLELNANSERGSERIEFNLNVNECYQYELNLRSESDTVSMCERTITSVPFSIKNKGTTSNDFNIKIEDGPVWARLNMDQVSLNVNESKTFLVALAPDYDKTGNYSIVVAVSPERGDVAARGTFNAEVRDCHAVELEVVPLEDTVCKGLTGTYTVNIKNNGERRKNYNILLDAPLWVRLTGESSVNLNPGRSTNVALFARPEEDTPEGEYAIKVLVSALDTSGTSAEETINLNVLGSDECFSADITLRYENIVVHRDSGLLVPLTFANEGSKSAEYNIVLGGSAAEFANLAERKLNLESGEEKNVDVYIAPQLDTSLGNYVLDVALNVNDAVLNSKTINVEVTDDPSRVTVINGDETAGNSGKNFLMENKFFVFLFLALVLIVILAVLFGRKAVGFFEDLGEEEEKTKKKKQEEN